MVGIGWVVPLHFHEMRPFQITKLLNIDYNLESRYGLPYNIKDESSEKSSIMFVESTWLVGEGV